MSTASVQCSFRTRTGARFCVVVEGRGGKEGFLFAHVPEPNLRAISRKTGRKRWFSFAHVPEPDKIYMIDTHQILVEQQWSDKVVKN